MDVKWLRNSTAFHFNAKWFEVNRMGNCISSKFDHWLCKMQTRVVLFSNTVELLLKLSRSLPVNAKVTEFCISQKRQQGDQSVLCAKQVIIVLLLLQSPLMIIETYPVSNISPLWLYFGLSLMFTVLLTRLPSTISWEKVSIPYLQKECQQTIFRQNY